MFMTPPSFPPLSVATTSVQYTTQQCLSILSLWFLSIELEDGNFELTRLSHVKAQMGKAELSHPLVVFITTTTFAVHLTPTSAVSGDATVSHSRKSNSGKKNMNNVSQSLGFFLYHRMIQFESIGKQRILSHMYDDIDPLYVSSP